MFAFFEVRLGARLRNIRKVNIFEERTGKESLPLFGWKEARSFEKVLERESARGGEKKKHINVCKL
jgi:hypothetical protein